MHCFRQSFLIGTVVGGVLYLLLLNLVLCWILFRCRTVVWSVDIPARTINRIQPFGPFPCTTTPWPVSIIIRCWVVVAVAFRGRRWYVPIIMAASTEHAPISVPPFATSSVGIIWTNQLTRYALSTTRSITTPPSVRSLDTCVLFLYRRRFHM